MAYSITIKRVTSKAPNRNRFLADRFLQSAVRHAQENRIEPANDALRQGLYYELGIGPHAGKPENPVLLYLQRVLDTNCRPSLVAAFGDVAMAQELYSTARILFERYLEINPHAADRKRIERTMSELDEKIRARALPSTFPDRLMNWFFSLR